MRLRAQRRGIAFGDDVLRGQQQVLQQGGLDTRRRLIPSGRLEYGLLIASAILSMAIGFYSPDNAMYAYFLNFASPLVRRWTERV